MAEKPQGITAITVGGYKSIREETTIEIRPLTILAGANSSGKSSIMQPMLLMKQTLEATYDPGPLLLFGSHVKLTKFEQLLPISNEDVSTNLTAGFTHGRNNKLASEFLFSAEQEGRQRQVEIAKMKIDTSRLRNVELTPDMSESEIVNSLPDYYRRRLEERDLDREIVGRFGWGIRTARCFLHIERFRKGRRRFNFPYSLPFDPVPEIQNHITNLVHVKGLRGNPERTYRVSPARGPNFPGEFENYIAGLVLRWQDENSEQIQWVERQLRYLGLTGWVEASRIDDVSVELKVGRMQKAPETGSDRDSVNIADVGFGVSQVLPVLMALAVSESGQVVYIEQPELHLHPRAQVALAGVLADAAKRGVRVVVETHSSLLLQGIMTLIAEGCLSNTIVKLHWFERNEVGDTKVTSRDFDENGTHEGDWPVDFANVRLAEQRRYLDAVARSRMGIVNEPS